MQDLPEVQNIIDSFQKVQVSQQTSPERQNQYRSESDAMDILKKRFASDEISEQVYRRIKSILKE